MSSKLSTPLGIEMVQVARRAPKLLGQSCALVQGFLEHQLHSDGGFRGRDAPSDLYYTVFGLEALLALQVALPMEKTTAYLRPFGAGKELDWVHLTCLARCWGILASTKREGTSDLSPPMRQEILQGIERCRAQDGGYSPGGRNQGGTVYAAFLALGAHQDLQSEIPRKDELTASLSRLETPDGAWANEPGLGAGSTSATAAAVAVLQQLNQPIKPEAGDWLLARHHPQGGFRANPQAPMPDLLSTATALHALAALSRDCAPIRESCLDFIDSLWTNAGGFYGHWGDDALDCEYAFYGLLALGHLS